jgi:hypothetical protein
LLSMSLFDVCSAVQQSDIADGSSRSAVNPSRPEKGTLCGQAGRGDLSGKTRLRSAGGAALQFKFSGRGQEYEFN